jgi:hypothetical protein
LIGRRLSLQKEDSGGQGAWEKGWALKQLNEGRA